MRLQPLCSSVSYKYKNTKQKKYVQRNTEARKINITYLFVCARRACVRV
jgi:hypothetical protein